MMREFKTNKQTNTFIPSCLDTPKCDTVVRKTGLLEPCGVGRYGVGGGGTKQTKYKTAQI